MQKKHRIFIAINLPEEVKRELFSYSEKYTELPAKWTAKDNLHITLEFLGDLTDEEIGEVCMIAKNTAEKYSCFSLNLNLISYGPPQKPAKGGFAGQAPKFVWAEGEKSEELASLKKDLEQALLESIRFAPELRNFSPHITLARINSLAFKQIEPEEAPEINESIDLPFTVESIEVMESVLKRKGPEYQVLESCRLGS